MATEPQNVTEGLQTKSNSQPCTKCKIQVPNELFNRHMQIHNVAERFSEKELLASLVLTTTEIKSQNETLMKLIVSLYRER